MRRAGMRTARPVTRSIALMILKMEVDFPVLRLFVKWTARPLCMAAQPSLHKSTLVGMKVTLSPEKGRSLVRRGRMLLSWGFTATQPT
jgi:hypothetical protein